MVLSLPLNPALSILESGPFETLSNYSFSPIPMFILMGVFASKARMSSELFNGAKSLFGGWRGGMALAAVTSCGIFFRDLRFIFSHSGQYVQGCIAGDEEKTDMPRPWQLEHWQPEARWGS